jgi:hypothetical protein
VATVIVGATGATVVATAVVAATAARP